VRTLSRWPPRGDFLTFPVVPALLDTIRPVFYNCHKITADLAETIPRDEVWKWKELWTAPFRAAVFAVVLACFLTDGTLASLATVAEQLGSASFFSSWVNVWCTQFLVKEEWKDRLSLTPEDYLHGVITVINELVRNSYTALPQVHESDEQSRLAVNAVTLGDFEAPLRISVFAKEVFTGFSMVRELLSPYD